MLYIDAASWYLVCLVGLCLLVVGVNPAETAELIEMPFGLLTCGVQGTMCWVGDRISPGEGLFVDILGHVRLVSDTIRYEMLF